MQEKLNKIIKINTKKKKQFQNSAKKEKGITLIALVVTIVVLLILAGVSIVVLFGDNGMIKTAGNSTLQTKLAEIEERANIAYADLNTKKYAEGNPTKKITMQDIKKELEKIDPEKYQVRIESPEGIKIKGITLDKTSIKLEKGQATPENLKATYVIEESSNTYYYVKVEGQYYEISISNNHINLEKTNGKTEKEIQGSGAIQTKTITAISSNSNVVNITEEQITQTDDGASIKIMPGTTVGEEATITVSCAGFESVTCRVIVKMVPIVDASKPNGNGTPIQNGYGTIDVIWLDENNKIITEPKAQILQSKANPAEGEKVKMTPVKWNGTAEEPANENNSGNDWYEYKAITENVDNTTSRWANAKTENGSYFVWIPRYAYRITYYESKENQTTPVGYCDGYGMWRPNGTLEYKLDEGIETVEAEDGNLYIVHPAFGSSNQKADETNDQYAARKTQNINNGGWGETLTGFWFAKFEMSQDENNLLASTPGVQSLRIKTIGEFYTMGRTATYGQTGVVDTEATDEITEASFMNSHMVKNSEWGAVAYLTHSKYGRNGSEITINDNDAYYTGGDQGITAYTNVINQKQSTTGNVYGVYDMSGGAYEYIAVFNNRDSNSYLLKSSKWTENTKLTISSNSTKYATKYANDDTTSNYLIGKVGDATKEVHIEGTSGNWLNDSFGFCTPRVPLCGRGRQYNDQKSAGIFSLSGLIGEAYSSVSFRTTLTP